MVQVSKVQKPHLLLNTYFFLTTKNRLGRSGQGAGHRPDRRLLFHEVQQQAQLGRKQSTVGEVRGRAAAAAGGAVPDQQPHPLVQGLLLHDQEDQGPVLPEVHLQPQGQHQEGNVHGGGEEQPEVSYATRFNIFPRFRRTCFSSSASRCTAPSGRR